MLWCRIAEKYLFLVLVYQFFLYKLSQGRLHLESSLTYIFLNLFGTFAIFGFEHQQPGLFYIGYGCEDTFTVLDAFYECRIFFKIYSQVWQMLMLIDLLKVKEVNVGKWRFGYFYAFGAIGLPGKIRNIAIAIEYFRLREVSLKRQWHVSRR